MGWPRKPPTPPKKHWPHKELNALEQRQPACNAQGSFYARPELAKRIEDVTCEVCKRLVEVVQ
jgi:hypothetical protein